MRYPSPADIAEMKARGYFLLHDSDPDNIFDHADIKEALETFWTEDSRE